MYAHWQEVLKVRWGIDARLTRLDGEYDLNFLAVGDGAHIFKVMRAGCGEDFVDMQCRAFEHIGASASNAPECGAVAVPEIIRTSSGDLYTTVADETGQPRIAWLMTRLPGVHYAYWRPRTPALSYRIGNAVGAMDRALADFVHPSLERSFKWNLTEALWIRDRYDAILDPPRRSIVDTVVKQYLSVHEALNALPSVAIHNDVNDHNILVDGSLQESARVSGLIDLGDMCAAPRICDLAVAGAYLVLNDSDPEAILSSLAAGYHAAYPLTPAEVDLIWPLLRMRLAVSVVNSTLVAIDRPDDPYVVISQKLAWDFLESESATSAPVGPGVRERARGVNPELIGPRLRAACGLPVTDTANDVTAWLDEMRGSFAPVLGCDLSTAPMGSLSVESSTTPQDPFSITSSEAAGIGAEFGADGSVWLGYYGEPRLIYTEQAFRKGPSQIDNRRTVHLGIDLFAAAGLAVHTPLEATVAFAGVRAAYLDYGGVVILRHETPGGAAFFTLYGHLAPGSLAGLHSGRRLNKGERFARLGDVSENGGWNPHLHLQLALTTAGFGDYWPGAADPDELFLLKEIFPNPAALLNVADERTAFHTVDRSTLLRDRLEKFGANLKLSYADPVMFLRGWKHYLFDEWGRPYLDCYNNVPHVGHSHPRIQAVAAAQLKQLNSNTRYLHPAQVAFADRILSKMPEQLSVCYFVNSGSEGNELALRLARAHTGGMDMITPDHGYHGNTTGAISISAYKFNAEGGIGQPDWVQLVEVADDYRGSFRRDDPDRAEKYAALVEDAIANIEARGGRLAGFIAETFPSVGGQIVPPAGYLPAVYRRIRAAGGVCIADEVQTGLGRLGDYYFGFEQQGAVPDIVVLGKPIGNGFPLGAVVTTRAIAASFERGPEFFSTFGGSTLSCAIGKAVLDIVDDERLMDNAREVGGYLLERLRALQSAHDIIGDVRGLGLFIGVEMVESRTSMNEAPRIASYIKNRMRENRILIGTEGPADNILKIRPPLTFDREGVDVAMHVLEGILGEVESHHRS